MIVAKLMGIECRALMTKMSAPIGNYVGNSLEILESINCLKGDGPSDLQILVELIGTYIDTYIILYYPKTIRRTRVHRRS